MEVKFFNAFDIFAPTYATSITFFVDDQSVVGAEVTAQLYEVDPSQSIANAPPLLLNESDPYTLTGPDIGNWKILQSTAPISLFPGSSYLAAVKGSQHPLDTSMISSANNPNSASYLQNNCPDANGNVGNWWRLASTPMIRLNIDGNNSSSIFGCTNLLALNYDPVANVDDGSCIFSQSDCSNLFISEYVEGPGQNNAIEIYNPTNSVIDLSGYSIKRYANGSTYASASNTFALSGLINPGDVIVVGNGQTDSILWGGNIWSLPVDTAFFSMLDDHCNGDYNANQTFYFNGDDAITLEYSGTIVDIFGKVGEDPGNAWTDDVSAG